MQLLINQLLERLFSKSPASRKVTDNNKNQFIFHISNIPMILIQCNMEKKKMFEKYIFSIYAYLTAKSCLQRNG